MTRKGVVSLVGVVSIVAEAALFGAASVQGRGGHRGGGDGNLWLLARAAGLSRSQITTAFKNDSILKSDRSNLSLTGGLTAAASAPAVPAAPRSSPGIYTLQSAQDRQVACNGDDDSSDDSGSGDSQSVDSEA
jgi:hypothetical protein